MFIRLSRIYTIIIIADFSGFVNRNSQKRCRFVTSLFEVHKFNTQNSPTKNQKLPPFREARRFPANSSREIGKKFPIRLVFPKYSKKSA